MLHIHLSENSIHSLGEVSVVFIKMRNKFLLRDVSFLSSAWVKALHPPSPPPCLQSINKNKDYMTSTLSDPQTQRVYSLDLTANSCWLLSRWVTGFRRRASFIISTVGWEWSLAFLHSGQGGKKNLLNLPKTCMGGKWSQSVCHQLPPR